LLHDQSLKFHQLCEFDKTMNKWEEVFHTMESEHQFTTLAHEEDKLIIFERGRLLFIFNFHHSKSYENYRVGTLWSTDHIFLFDTDNKEVGGHGRLNSGYEKRFVP
jgi:1,4-alpha-glucan branching enzyme